MGFSIYYASTRTLSLSKVDTVRAAAAAANRGRSWLSSEPVHFFPALQDGKLVGGSKPNVTPHPEDRNSADASGLPDGGPRDVIEILARLSRDYGIDWEVTHDFGPLGSIRDGVADPDLIDQIDAIAGLGNAIGEFDGEEFA